MSGESQGQLIDLSRRADNKILHVYSPESEDEADQILSEIDVFILEYGLQHMHTVCRPNSDVELISVIENFINDACPSKEKTPGVPIKVATIITWGHGHCFDNQLGFFKIFYKPHLMKFILINDLIQKLKCLNEKLDIKIQLLMTQCWAHCHDQAIYSSSSLVVDWLSSIEFPETSARRWDSKINGQEMHQDEFERFVTREDNYEQLQSAVRLKHKDIRQRIFLKYLLFSSIHVEATCYIYRQRMLINS